ncbi:N-acetylneuraminate synthase family protein [Candidatus Pelagibacter sp. Uisw_121]|uniref:N-acetylneuraminate synthase family protein n=1 Tax=Candidatus Pelagibacter sp. Uisw_121 TaxID=3230987 RepID=UPI0039EAADD6
MQKWHLIKLKIQKKKQRQIDLLKPLELKKNDYFILKTFANKNKINFLSSPFDEENYLFLTKNLKCKEIKIPSGEINNFLMLSNINLKKEYIFISTGMSNLEEIAHTLNFIAKKKVFKVKKSRIIINDKKKLLFLKKRLCLLHCVTDYPVDDKFANLNAIKTLEKEFQLNVGYSDHTAGILAPIIAASLGAKVIEKHITLNKKLKGPDHKASLNPIEFKKMVKQIRKLETMMGNGKKVLQKCEIKNMLIARKSIVAKKKY